MTASSLCQSLLFVEACIDDVLHARVSQAMLIEDTDRFLARACAERVGESTSITSEVSSALVLLTVLFKRFASVFFSAHLVTPLPVE